MKIFITVFTLSFLCDSLLGASVKGGTNIRAKIVASKHDLLLFDESSEEDREKLKSNFLCFVNTIYEGILCFTKEGDLQECLQETKSAAFYCAVAPYLVSHEGESEYDSSIQESSEYSQQESRECSGQVTSESSGEDSWLEESSESYEDDESDSSIWNDEIYE